MSRIGKKQINIPEGVTIDIKSKDITVKGTKGELNLTVRPEIMVELTDNVLQTKVVKNTKEASAYWGLTRALIANMIKGVTDGFEKKLELVGVGYRVKPVSEGISLTLGYSHPVEFKKPE